MSAHVADAYDRRSAEYIAVLGEITQMDAADLDLIGAWRDATPGRLLDAGCGPGHWAQFLRSGGREVLGIDLSAQFIAHARSTYPKIEFVAGSITDLPASDASLGGILAWYSLIHMPPEELPAALAEFARVLAPGGSILIGFFDGPPGEPFDHAVAPAYYWSADALGELLDRAGLTATASESRARAEGEISAHPHASLMATRR